MAQITGKTVVVTGASRGIGLEFVKQLADRGNKIIAAARTPHNAPKLQELASKHDKTITLTKLDVASQDSVTEWAQRIRGEVDHVDFLINNAGVTDGWMEFDDVSAQAMLHCFATNTVGPLLVAQSMVQLGLLGPPGSVIANMTSKMGSIDDNTSGGDYAYRASKCALNIVNRSMAIDLADSGIISVLLHPGYVKTDMTGWNGLIDTSQCVSGLLKVLGSVEPQNSGEWYDYKGEKIPW